MSLCSIQLAPTCMIRCREILVALTRPDHSNMTSTNAREWGSSEYELE
jgi:hypothetical protein